MSKQDLTVETSCGACVYRIQDEKAEILLIKPNRSNGSWGIPKGHVDSGESLVEAAHREVFEEAGIKIATEEKLDVVFTKPKQNVKKYVHAWLARQVCTSIPQGEEDPDKEIANVMWFDINELPPIHWYQKSLIEQAVKLICDKMTT